MPCWSTFPTAAPNGMTWPPLLDRIDAFASLRTVPGLFEQVRTDPGGYGVSWNDDIDLDGSELWENGQPVSSQP